MHRSRTPHALAVLLAVAAALAVGHGVRAAGDDDLLVPLVPPPSLARWGKVPAWEGTFHATRLSQTKIGTTITIVNSASASGTVELTQQTSQETLASDQDPKTWHGASRWAGKVRGSVRTDLQGVTRGPQRRTTRSAGGAEGRLVLDRASVLIFTDHDRHRAHLPRFRR